MAEYAAGRPFAWVDDQLTGADVRWCADEYPAPTLLLPIDPAIGLRRFDIAAIERWLEMTGRARPEASGPGDDKDRPADEYGPDAFRP